MSHLSYEPFLMLAPTWNVPHFPPYTHKLHIPLPSLIQEANSNTASSHRQSSTWSCYHTYNLYHTFPHLSKCYLRGFSCGFLWIKLVSPTRLNSLGIYETHIPPASGSILATWWLLNKNLFTELFQIVLNVWICALFFMYISSGFHVIM